MFWRIKNRIKRTFAKKDLVLLGIGVVFAVFFTIIGYRPGLWFNAANFLFCVGIFFITAGFCVHIRNIGLFKAFSYIGYKRSFRRHGKADPSANPLSFAEYAIELTKKRKSLKEYFILGIPFVALSYLIVFLFA